MLIVDDFPEWRTQVRELVALSAKYEIIGEACDGHEAVESAVTLQPALILLDIALPGMNGIEAARLIRKKCPNSAIVFVTGNGDGDVRELALRTGASAYVSKAHAADELLKVLNSLDIPNQAAL